MTRTRALTEFDIRQPITPELVDYLVNNPDHPYSVTLADEKLVMEAKWLLFNIHFWKPLNKRQLPICRKHVMYKALLTLEEIQRILNEISTDVRALYGKDFTFPIAAQDIAALDYDLLEVIDDVYNVIASKLGAYVRSIDLFQILDLLAEPRVRDVVEIDITKEEKVGIHAVEKKLMTSSNDLIKLLSDKELPNNAMYPYVTLGAVSVQQLPQVLLAQGLRTDVNDMIVTRPIMSSYVSGMTNAVDFVIESLSARKSIFYTMYGMPKAQYSNRKQQIMISPIRFIYCGDCGAEVPVPFMITQDNYDQTVGKNIILSDSSIFTITKDNAKTFIGKTVNLKSAFTCRHTDGVCHMCGGKITELIPQDLHIGNVAVIEYMERVGQLILSNKHVSRTNVCVYVIPEHALNYFISKKNEIYFSNPPLMREMSLGIPYECMPQIQDLRHVVDERSINEHYFSKVEALVFANRDRTKVYSSEIYMTDENDITPHFSTNMLKYIKNNPDKVQIGDIIWIDLSQLDTTKSILKCSIENDSMIKFTKDTSDMLLKKIKDYHSIPELLKDFSNLVYKKVKPNLMHLELILKSSLVSSGYDYSIPQVHDINNVEFNSLLNIVPRRSIGGQFAFQRQLVYLAMPDTYILPKPKGVFDNYMGFMD